MLASSLYPLCPLSLSHSHSFCWKTHFGYYSLKAEFNFIVALFVIVVVVVPFFLLAGLTVVSGFQMPVVIVSIIVVVVGVICWLKCWYWSMKILLWDFSISAKGYPELVLLTLLFNNWHWKYRMPGRLVKVWGNERTISLGRRLASDYIFCFQG